MAALTDTAAGGMLAHILKQTPYAQPAGLFLGLHTENPTKAGLRTYEVTIGALTTGYIRHDIGLKMAAPTGSPPRSTNSSVITIGPALTDWGNVKAGSVDDDQNAGTMLFYGLASESRTITIGESFQLVIGQFAARFQ